MSRTSAPLSSAAQFGGETMIREFEAEEIDPLAIGCRNLAPVSSPASPEVRE